MPNQRTAEGFFSIEWDILNKVYFYFMTFSPIENNMAMKRILVACISLEFVLIGLCLCISLCYQVHHSWLCWHIVWHLTGGAIRSAGWNGDSAYVWREWEQERFHNSVYYVIADNEGFVARFCRKKAFKLGINSEVNARRSHKDKLELQVLAGPLWVWTQS